MLTGSVDLFIFFQCSVQTL